MVAQPNRKKASFVVTQLTWLCVLILYVQAASDLCLEVFFFFLCSFLCPFFSAFFFLHFHWNDTGMLASSSENSVNNHRDPHHQRSIQLPAQSSPYLQLEATLLQWAAGSARKYDSKWFSRTLVLRSHCSILQNRTCSDSMSQPTFFFFLVVFYLLPICQSPHLQFSAALRPCSFKLLLTPLMIPY